MQSTPLKPKRTKTPEQALAALMRLCARAEKAESDAWRLMQGWGISAPDAEEILQRLVRERFIDERRYAAAFVREKTALSGWGAYKIRAALQRKKVAREAIEEALRQIDRNTSEERLQQQLARKLRTARAATPYELRTKLIRYGLSLGYDYEAVCTAAARLVKHCEPCDDF